MKSMGVRLLGLLLVLGACGGSADESSAGVDDSATSAPTSAEGGMQEFCDAIDEMESASDAAASNGAAEGGVLGDPVRARQLLENIRQTAPSDISEDADAYFGAMELAADPMGESGPPDPEIDEMPMLEIRAAGERVAAYTEEHCGGPAG